MAKTITWTPPLAQTVGCTATAEAGGSLDATTTYYYKVIAVDSTSCNIEQSMVLYGSPSAEFSETTTDVNKQIALSWDAVADAEAYYVFRTETSDDYSNSKRFKRLSDSSNSAPTLTGTSFTDDGSYPFYTTAALGMMPSDSKPILGTLDYTTNYGGILEIEDGTSSDPITLEDIYDYFVSDVADYENYVFYDGYTFALLGSFDFNTGVETFFEATNKVIIYTKTSSFYETTGSSNIQFGELDSSGMAINGCRIVNMGSYYCKPGYSTGTRLYDTTDFSVYGDTEWTQGTTNMLGARWCDYSAASDSKDFKIEGYTYARKFGDTPVADLVLATSFCELNQAPNKLAWRIKSKAYYNLVYGNTTLYRLDEFTTYATTYQYRIRDNASQIIKLINPICPKSTDSEKLPTFLFAGSDGTVKVYFNVILKVIDKDDVVSGAGVVIKDKNGDLGEDYDEGDTSFTTDTDGMIFAEKINITSVSSDSITDSTKSWTTDEWLGRNVYINSTGEILKVKSNTATTITLISDFVSEPSVDDNAGIILELLRFTEVQAGRTDYNPFTLTISKSGYKTYECEFTLSEKTNWTITLSKVKDNNFSKRVNFNTQ